MAGPLRRDGEQNLENVLQRINTEFIALNKEEKRRNNIILHGVLEQIIEKMKQKSELFESMYRTAFYGGSYYDKLKVGRPDEYDLDLLFDLPKFARPVLDIGDIPGFVEVHLENVIGFLQQPYASKFPNFANKLLDEQHYLSTSKVSSWIESVLTLAVNGFPSLSGNYPHVKQIHTLHGTFYFTVHKAGPAFTLKLKGKVDEVDVVIDIDLVPCFVFTNNQWPGRPYRQNPYSTMALNERVVMDEFFVVPKKPTSDGSRSISSYWRLSFQQQEGALINGLQYLKPALRLLKKLRDACQFPIASYYLKTIILWEVEEGNMNWKHSLSHVFMRMLRQFQQYLENGEIPYFWNSQNNLISRVGDHQNMANRLQRIINAIERHPNEPARIRIYLESIIPEAAGYGYWRNIEDLPENQWFRY